MKVVTVNEFDNSFSANKQNTGRRFSFNGIAVTRRAELFKINELSNSTSPYLSMMALHDKSTESYSHIVEFVFLAAASEWVCDG